MALGAKAEPGGKAPTRLLERSYVPIPLSHCCGLGFARWGWAWVVGGSSCAASALTIRGDKILWPPVYDAVITIMREWQPFCRCHFPQALPPLLPSRSSASSPSSSVTFIHRLFLARAPLVTSLALHVGAPVLSLLLAPPPLLAPVAFPLRSATTPPTLSVT